MTALFTLAALRKAAPYLLAAAILIAALFAIHTWFNRSMDEAHSAGAASAQNEAATEALENVRKSNDAAEAVRRDRAVNYEQCVQDSRTPANCRR